MIKFQDIKGLSGSHVELLETAGYLESSTLKNSSIEEIHSELVKANEMLGILENSPTKAEVTDWWKQVNPDVEVFTLSTEIDDEAVVCDEAVSNDANVSAENDTLISVDVEAREAVVVTEGYVAKHRINVTDLPKAGESLMNLSVDGVKKAVSPVSHKSIELRQKESWKDKGQEKLRVQQEKASEFQKERVLSMDEFREKGGKVAPLVRSEGSDLTKMTRSETNKGVKPESRRYVRGVLHKEPGSVLVSSFALLLSFVLVIVGLAGIPLVLWDKEQFFWAIYSPSLIVVAFLVWFFIARKGSCPVCRQRQYSPKACFKHVKAHRIPFLGYMISTAIHVILFNWFRCIFCGTSIRIKE